MGKLKNIMVGHFNELKSKMGNPNPDVEDIAKIRLNICNVCPINSNGICDSKLYLDPETLNFSDYPRQGYYKGCGCRLEPKTRVLSESCPAKLWGGEKKISQNENQDIIPIISLSGSKAKFSFDKYYNMYHIDYGDITTESNTELKFNLQIKASEIREVKSSCGCTTPKLFTENGNTMLTVKYDNTIKGAFRKNVSITTINNKKTTIQLRGHVR